jgi:histone H3/H4
MHRRFDELKLLVWKAIEIAPSAGRKIIDNDDMITTTNEGWHKMAANKARPSSH